MKSRSGRSMQLALLLVAGAFLLPQLWLFSLSTKTKAQVYEYPPKPGLGEDGSGGVGEVDGDEDRFHGGSSKVVSVRSG